MSVEETSELNAEKCQRLVDKFVEVTNSDSACAQFYLQDRNWNLERSLYDYFETLSPGTGEEAVVSDVGLTLLNALGPDYQLTTIPPPTFNFVSWNVDGLSAKNLKKRTKAVCKILFSEKVDVVFLQELVPETVTYIEDRLPEYHVISGRMDNEDYFTAVLLLRFTVQYESHRIIPFESSVMKRNLLCVKANIGDTKLELVNSHLESTKDFASERIKQLRIGFKYITSHSLDRTCVFAGDFNLRDKEVQIAGGLPAGVEDIWERCGSRPEVRYTWDTKRNCNASSLITQSQFRGYFPRLRFDRAYIRYSSLRDVVPKHFGLIGLQKVSGIQSFPSDHWGIRAWFEIRRNSNKNENKGGDQSDCKGAGSSKGNKKKTAEIDFDAVD